MPTNAKKNVYKEKEFQTYVLWKSLPAFFRGMQKKELQSYGFNDPLILKIVMIKNQTSFAKKFGIKDLGTLTDWNNRIKNNNLESFTLNNIFKKEFENINIKNIPKHKNISRKKKVLPKKISLKNQNKLEIKEDINPPQLKPRTISEKIKDAFFRWKLK
ncbi:MAG: hypothetical protein AAB438_01550 [Patescibacteria group bacterium]